MFYLNFFGYFVRYIAEFWTEKSIYFYIDSHYFKFKLILTRHEMRKNYRFIGANGVQLTSKHHRTKYGKKQSFEK